jgi:hypothetical protein
MIKEDYKEMPYKFSSGEKILKVPYLSKLFVHWANNHKTKAVVFDSPAPWLGNAVGKHPIPFTFIQTYCESCKEKFGITYLESFDYYSLEPREENLTEEKRRQEVEKINEYDKLLKV